jgi:hypothetical protein
MRDAMFNHGAARGQAPRHSGIIDQGSGRKSGTER